jgi:hypothetical protein
MNQALYAHMNNKRKRKKKKRGSWFQASPGKKFVRPNFNRKKTGCGGMSLPYK